MDSLVFKQQLRIESPWEARTLGRVLLSLDFRSLYKHVIPDSVATCDPEEVRLVI